MSEGEDYYRVLGISRDSDSGAIKKAYKELALRWHPDKNADQKQLAEAKFKLIAEAYQTLSDPEKRSVYDRYGKEGLRRAAHQGGFSGVDPTDVGLSAAFESFRKVFEDMYDGAGGFPFGDLFGGGFFGRSTGGGRSQASMDPFSGFFSSGSVFSSSTNMSSFSSRGSGVRSCSRSNQTYTVNGKTVNIVKEIDSSGRVTQTVTKFSGPGQITEKTVEIYGPTGALESRTDINKDGNTRALQNKPGGNQPIKNKNCSKKTQDKSVPIIKKIKKKLALCKSEDKESAKTT